MYGSVLLLSPTRKIRTFKPSVISPFSFEFKHICKTFICYLYFLVFNTQIPFTHKTNLSLPYLIKSVQSVIGTDPCETKLFYLTLSYIGMYIHIKGLLNQNTVPKRYLHEAFEVNHCTESCYKPSVRTFNLRRTQRILINLCTVELRYRFREKHFWGASFTCITKPRDKCRLSHILNKQNQRSSAGVQHNVLIALRCPNCS